MSGGGLSEVIHDDGVGQFVIGKKLAVPVIDVAPCGGNGDRPADAELEVVQVILAVDDLQNEQAVNQNASRSDDNGDHDQGAEVEFPKEITPKEACDMVINAKKKVNHLFSV